MSAAAVQGSQQLLAPEISDGVGQLGSCPEGQVLKEPQRYLLEGNSFALLTIIRPVKGAVGAWKEDAPGSAAWGEAGAAV